MPVISAPRGKAEDQEFRVVLGECEATLDHTAVRQTGKQANKLLPCLPPHVRSSAEEHACNILRALSSIPITATTNKTAKCLHLAYTRPLCAAIIPRLFRILTVQNCVKDCDSVLLRDIDKKGICMSPSLAVC